MNRRIPRLMPARKRGPIAMLGVVVAASLAVAGLLARISTQDVRGNLAA